MRAPSQAPGEAKMPLILGGRRARSVISYLRLSGTWLTRAREYQIELVSRRSSRIGRAPQ